MRSPWVLVSIVAHSLAITAAAIAPLVAAVDLPAVHSPLPAYVAVFAKDIELPAPPPARGGGPVAVTKQGPPFEAPKGIKEETPFEQLETEIGQPGQDIEPQGTVGGNPIGLVVPPPAPPREETPVRVSEGIEAPRKIVDVPPAYPPIALGARKEGMVVLEAIIDTQGYVKDLRVLYATPLFEKAALDAVRQWRYTPTLLNGQPVPVIMTVTVNFRLGK